MITTKTKPIISINPPPKNKCCDCCKKNMEQAKVFGGKGDPLVGDFTGAKLVKTFRPMAQELTDEELNERFGDIQEKGFYIQLMDTIEASWECRDCIVLSDEDYFKKREGGKK